MGYCCYLRMSARFALMNGLRVLKMGHYVSGLRFLLFFVFFFYRSLSLAYLIRFIYKFIASNFDMDIMDRC